tara:strand:- start:1363 stop:2058 length:696 start_codon:yes stop_codon:yes gene_type:complete
MRIAVIPARGGSKRIPRKNIRDFCGKPIIAYTIEALQQSGVVDRIWVSTDDEEIAEVAKSFGAEIPFLRANELSDDLTPTIPVIAHAVKVMLEQRLEPEAVCCAYATAPLMRASVVADSADILVKGNWKYVFAAARFGFPIWRSFAVDEDSRVSMFFPEKFAVRSQDLPAAWQDAGQFYWGTPDAWTDQLPFFAKHSSIFELPSWQISDIDSEDDWRRAEILSKLISEKKN